VARSTFKKIDAKGRLYLPARWRNKIKTRSVLVVEREDKLEIIPLKSIPPSALFDSIVVDDDVDFTDPYDLERVVLEKPWRDNA